ncbi:polyprenyl synthetase family protein [Streptomyces sp. URMC 127]|uniref:polyprenyl synthetase family protein n=1 Tax=Streptomyces sp. URMC 127 TaxID=3423402 RepID=UPI003F1D6EA4
MSGLMAVEVPSVTTVNTLLEWAWDLVEPALKDAVAALPEPEARIAGYHRGWREPDDSAPPAVPAARHGGKAVRAALALLSARAVGGPATCAVPGAVGVELIHDFSLLHDDVIDGDPLRRHRPAAWSVYGIPAAVLAGDALLVTGLHVLSASASCAADAVVREVVDMLGELLNGQSQDVSFERSRRVTAEQYLVMAEGKTGALMGCACALGGLLAQAPDDRVAGLRDFGRRLGVAFQCVDDLLGIWGTSGRSGKPVGTDLATRKKSLPVVAALADEGPAGRRLAALYEQPDPFGEPEIALATTLIEEAGGREKTEQQVEQQTVAAVRALTRAEPAPEVYRQMQEIAALLTSRDH